MRECKEKGRHHMRGIYEKVKGSKDFYIRYTDAQGQRHREHVGRYAAAVEALVNRRREVREGKFIAPHSEERITFAELSERMLAFQIAHDFAESTVDTNRRRRLRFLPLLGNLLAREITPSKINEVLLHLKFTKNKPELAEGKKYCPGRAPLTPGQISSPAMNAHRFFLSGVFRFGIENGLLEKNPVEKTRMFMRHEGIIRYLTSDEEAALREVIQEDCPAFLPALDLALHTGLRKHEQFLLTWDKIDLDRGILTVPSNTKTGRRFLPINSVCRRAIEELHVLSAGSPRVVQGSDQWMGSRFRKWVAQAKVMNFRWHDLRHTFASRLVMAGVDLRQVQEFMGHSSIVTTMRYAHLSPEHGKAAIEKLVATAAAPAEKVKVAKIA